MFRDISICLLNTRPSGLKMKLRVLKISLVYLLKQADIFAPKSSIATNSFCLLILSRIPSSRDIRVQKSK